MPRDHFAAPPLLYPPVSVRPITWHPWRAGIGPGRPRWQGSIVRCQHFGPEWKIIRDTRDEALRETVAIWRGRG